LKGKLNKLEGKAMKVRKLIGGTLLAVSLLGSSASGADLERVICKPESYWRAALLDFFDEAQADAKGAKISVSNWVEGQLELLTQLAGAYSMSVKDLERAYSLAVKKAVESSIPLLKRCTARKLGEPDTAILFQEITPEVKDACAAETFSYIKANATGFLREALLQCDLLHTSPLMDSFLSDGKCRLMMNYFPYQAQQELYRFLSKEESKLYSDPKMWKTERLRTILKTLKDNGLIITGG